MNYPKISIVTPNFNQADFLEQTIISVLNQNYPNLEYIIIDGGSTDASVEIIKKYEKYLAYWKSEPDNGHYDAVNYGLSLASGEIMTWINSDDLLHPGALDAVAGVFQNHHDVDWITGRPNSTNEVGMHFRSKKIIPVYSRKKFMEGLYWQPFIQQEGTFWRRKLWNESGGYVSKEYKLAGDFELWNRFFRYARIYSVNKHLGCFRVREGQRSLSNLNSYLWEVEKVIRKEKQLDFTPTYNQDLDKSALIIPLDPALDNNSSDECELLDAVFIFSELQSKNDFELSEIFFDRVKEKILPLNKNINYPKISIILTSMNDSEILDNAFFSSINQTYPNLEIIFVSQGSIDKKSKLVEKYRSFISHHIEVNSDDLSCAVRKGFERASGDIMHWLNSEHYIEPGALFDVAIKYFKNTDADGWIGGYRLFSNSESKDRIINPNKINFNDILHNWDGKNFYFPSFFLSAEFVKKKILDDNLNTSLDLDFWINSLNNANIILSNEVWVNTFRENS